MDRLVQKALQSNIRQTKASSTSTAKSSDHNVQPFRVAAYFEEYQRRKEYRLKQLEKQEREQRKHIAKKMPNFDVIHSRNRILKGTSCVVSPQTPEVLKRGLEMKEKLKRKVIINET